MIIHLTMEKYYLKVNNIKYHVSCTDGKISVRINLLFYLFFTVVPSNVVFLSCRPFVMNMTSSTGLVGVEVSFVCPSQETEETSTPRRPVKNVIIMTKGLQERNTQRWMGQR